MTIRSFLRRAANRLLAPLGVEIVRAARLQRHGYRGRIGPVEPLPRAHALRYQAAAAHPVQYTGLFRPV